MNVESTKNVLKRMPVSKAVMLSAKHGVGKSSVVKQVSEELTKETGKKHDFYDVRLSQCEIGDIKGLPYEDKENGVVKFLKPFWWPKDENSHGVLFFDELNRATKDVLNAIFEICLDRRLDGEPLPDGWRVVAAVNADDDYDVAEFDHALYDRWFHIDFDPGIKEWVSWARSNDVHPAVIQFVERNENLADPPVGSLESGRVYPSRRSWVSLSDCIHDMNLLDSGMESELTQVTKGWVGREIAIMFPKFVANEFTQLKPEDILDSLEDVEDQVKSACDDIEVITSLANSVVAEVNKRPASKMKDLQKNSLKRFFMMLPNDIASNTWVLLLQGRKSKKIAMSWNTDKAFEAHLTLIYDV